MLFTITHRKHQMSEERKCTILRKILAHFEFDAAKVEERITTDYGNWQQVCKTIGVYKENLERRAEVH